MTDKKNEERTIKDVLCDDIDRRLEENPPKMPTLEEFKAMAYERLAEADAKGTDADTQAISESRETVKVKGTKTKTLKTAGLVAGFVIAVIIGAFAFNAYIDDVGADKNPKEEIVTEDGVIIEDGGWGSSDGEDGVWVITDWEHVEAAKETIPELLIPGYIPEGYEFEKLTIETVSEGMMICEYIFNNGESIVEIESQHYSSTTSSFNIGDVARKVESQKGMVYIQEYNKKIATIQIDDGILLYIESTVSDNDIIKIIDSLKN